MVTAISVLTVEEAMVLLEETEQIGLICESEDINVSCKKEFGLWSCDTMKAMTTIEFAKFLNEITNDCLHWQII